MAGSRIAAALLLTPFLLRVNAATQCAWLLPRANIIRDTLYVDGGQLWTKDGDQSPENDGNFEGTVYALNFTDGFNTNTSQIPAQQSGQGNIAPNFVDGAMLSNDYEFALYGGLIRSTDSERAPDEDAFLEYYKYRSDFGPYIQNFNPGFVSQSISDGTTRYITGGAAVSVPSERLGFYFSGMRAPDWGPIWSNGTANTTSDTLITVDMTQMGDFNFTNTTLPSQVPGRANAELVWLPLGARGSLVAIGGVINPEYIFRNGPEAILSDSQISESQRVSPGFMNTVSIYDIDNGRWYQQNTTASGSSDQPPQLTQFCSIVAAANDSSSYNIYIYGGYAGLDVDTDVPSDDVYILSIPSFTWFRAYSGDDTRGRYGHRCVKPYPDQMFILGGYGTGSPASCVSGGMVQVFNLNTLEFQNSYDPQTWGYYEVPSVVSRVIGGDGRGGATALRPDTWGDDALPDLLSMNYTGTAARQWFPYGSTETTNNSTPTAVPREDDDDDDDGGLPGWVAPVLGVVLGLVFVSALAVGWMLWHRRKALRRRSTMTSETASRSARNPVIRWLNGMPPPQPPKSEPTITSSDVDPAEKRQSPVLSPVSDRPNTFEAASSTVHQLHGDSTVAELPTGFNVIPPNSPGSPHSLYSSSAGLPSPMSAALAAPTPGSSPTPDPSASPAVLPVRADSHPTRPTHHRNFSSLSSGIDVGSSLPDEENQRQSQYLSDLPSPGDVENSPVSPERFLSVDPMISASSRPARPGKSQSSFGEILDEKDDDDRPTK